MSARIREEIRAGLVDKLKIRKIRDRVSREYHIAPDQALTMVMREVGRQAVEGNVQG